MAEKKQATQISLFQNPPDKELIAAIKRVPPQYRGQIIALAHYLQLQKAHEEKVKAKVTDVIHKNKKAKIPIIQEANKIISGERGLNEEEKKYVLSNLRPNEKPEPSDFGGDQIQDYWLKVFTNCERLRKEVHELDYPVLKSLRTIEHILDEQDKYNFTLRFTFGENEYFSDEVLTVRFVMANQGVDIARIEATPINWKEKKNYIKRMVQFKQQNKKTGQTRVVQRPMQIHSFFNFFKSMRPKGTEDEQDRALREMGLRHNLALLIRDEVLTYHLEYFVGKRSGGIDYPLYLDHIREEADETSSPNKSQKKNDKEEKKVQKSPGTKKAEAIKPTGKQAETAKPQEPENKGCGVQ